MIDGSPVFSQTAQIAILAAWSVVTFAIALKIFRWQ
jgi:hypothetical protein